MTFSKMVTQRIVNLWGLGATAEETQTALRDEGIKICTNTIYAKRRSLTAQEMIDELEREQRRDIAKADEVDTRCHWRNELLKILVPQRIEAFTKSELQITKNETIDVNVFNNDEQSILNEAARILDRKSTAKSNSIH